MLGLCFYYWASNPAHASGWNDHTFNSDIDYYKDSYLEANPNAILTDWQWFPGSGETDGDYTNDQFCFPFANNGDPYIIIGTNSTSTCDWWTQQTRYVGAEIISFFDLNLIAEPDPAPIGIYQGQQAYVGVLDDETNIFGDGAEYWSGCYSTGNSPTWADGQGNGGGECPIINNDSNQINFGYVRQTLSQISAIDTALKNAGLETTGYTYSWRVKNADANFEDTNGAQGQDTLSVTLSIKDNGGNTVYEKTYDYSYHIDTWTTMSGEENFTQPFDLSTLEAIQLDVTAQDLGGWEGWYGPEFDDPKVVIKYRPIIKDNTEELLFEQMCMNDPLYDANCPGYQTAMIDQMNQVTNIASAEEDVFGEDPAITGTPSVEDFTNDGTVQENPTGEPDPVQEAIAEATPDPVQEAVEQTTEEATEVAEADPNPASDPASDPASGGSGLNATQLSALDAANNVANSAVSSATNTAQASAGIGLSESGGVGSALTSVDPTGSTREDGGVAGGTDFEFDSSTDATGTSIADAITQTAGTSATQSFDNTQQLDSEQSFSNGSDDGSSQGNTAGSTGDAQADSTTDFASNGQQDTQDSNPLAGSEAVETTDITGEQALEVSSESISQLATLTDSTSPINQIINEVTAKLLSKAVDDSIETAEESVEESFEDQNAKEDALVEAAQNGSDDEDAQAALLGYNPNFRAYQQPQMQGGEIYNDQGVYLNQKTYDNPRAGLFNGASDATHRAMVRSQYERGQ